MKQTLIVFLITFFLMFMASALAHAESASSSGELAAKKYGVTFPVAELGNCANLSECRTYCDDPLHQTQCVEFAKKQGFYKEDKTAIKNAIAIAAKNELGCDSIDACKQFCGEQENWQKCGEFAKKHHLGGGQTEDPGKKEILNKAKEVLGCDSINSCKGFCEKEENRQKCDEFAKLVGLRGGSEKKGPGGCSSLDSCKAFCAEPENFQICQEFAKSRGENFKGPGGCDSEESCKTYCKDHEQECKKYFKGVGKLPSGYSMYEVCSRTPNCKWINDKCECKSANYTGSEGIPAYMNADEMARFCREFPEKCASTSGQYSPYPYSSSSDPTSKTPYPTYTPKPSYTPYPTYTPKPTYTPYPTSNSSCQMPSGGCGQYYYWDSTKCICKSYEEYCKSKGCTWTNNSCQCSTTYSPTPYPSYSPTISGNTGTSSSVQGVSKVRNLIQQFLDWLSP